MSSKLLITGAHGFIGKYLIEEPILKKFELLTPSRKELNYMNKSAVSKYIEENCPSYLIHLAWNTDPNSYKTSLDNINWTEASGHLFKEFYKRGGFKTIAAGTGLEYDQSYGYFLEDTTPIAPKTLYGICKNYTNNILKRHEHPYSWARIFNVYGYGEQPSRLITDTINSIINDKQIVIKNPNIVSDYIYVKDVSRILSELLFKSHRKEINISSGQATSIRYIVDYITEKLDGQQYISYETGLNSMYVGNNSRLYEMEMEPKYSLTKGIDEMIKLMVK